ncbi:MAG: hydratase [Alphaproteobacteria bacterium]|nr:hydratase [Alphaproteobacteria bacterium]
MRLARGEIPVGYKVGFTNRTIWARYEVYAPIWGTVWDSTLIVRADETSLARLCQPRLEPEIVFGLAATPSEDPTLDHVFASIDWLAPGFEIVQSHLPDWQFTAADTVADGGLHGRLLVGAKRAARDIVGNAQDLDRQLAVAQVELFRDGRVVERGLGHNVLDSPLQALRHFIREIQACPGAPPLRPGDLVTTGTWTDAWPLAPGQAWRAVFTPPFGEVGMTTA